MKRIPKKKLRKVNKNKKMNYKKYNKNKAENKAELLSFENIKKNVLELKRYAIELNRRRNTDIYDIQNNKSSILFEKILIKINQTKLDSNYTKNVKNKNKSYVNKKMNINGIEISNKVIVNVNSIKNRVPYIIRYENYNYVIRGANPKDNFRVTWHCENYLKMRNSLKGNTRFCESTIQGIRENIESSNFCFYLKKQHSNLCIKENNFDKSKLNINSPNKMEKIRIEQIENIEIENKKDFSNYLENYIKESRTKNLSLREFRKYGNDFYRKHNLNKLFTIDNNFLKNAYYKLQKKYYELHLENVYEYTKTLKNDEYFCRNISIKQLITKDKHIIEHKSLIFFSDFDIKRLINSEHLLLDGTFIFPVGYMQTIIIMYYDIIIEKMIPGIFIVSNNKTQEGYLDCFYYIKNYIDFITNFKEDKIKFETFTTDFEKGLFNAFDKIFNKNKNIKHIGCYFHYIQNIRKYMQSNHLATSEKKNIYNNMMNICKQLPFIKINYKKIINYIKDKSIMNYDDLENFISYFEHTWINFFKDGTLNLDDTNIKFRTNNSLERFNRTLKEFFGKKKNISLKYYIDILIEEVNSHEEYLINENKKPFKIIAKNYLKGNIPLEKDNKHNIVFYEKVYLEIISDFKENLICVNNSNYENDNNIINDYNIFRDDSEEKLIDSKNFNTKNFVNFLENNISEKNEDFLILNNFKINSSNNKNFNNDKNKIETSEINYAIVCNSLCGLNNLGNTCYMNSSLQILIHNKIFVKKIIIEYERKEALITNAFLELLKLMNKEEYTYNNTNLIENISVYSISPIIFKSKFTIKHQNFSFGQHDSIEFIRFLLEDISNETNRNTIIAPYLELNTLGKSKNTLAKEFHNLFIRRENSFIIDIFYTQLITIFRCKCEFESYSFQKVLDIPLLLSDDKMEFNLLNLIRTNFGEENINWNKKCDNCKKKDNHKKVVKFSILNEIIIFSIQRFDKNLRIKNHSFVSFPEIVDLKNFCDETLSKLCYKYRLISIIHHTGEIDYGHYYSEININNNWYLFNDSQVKLLDKLNFNSDSVLILFYMKI